MLSASRAPMKRGKYVTMSLAKKAAIIKLVESGRSRADVAKEFQISKQTLSDYIKNKQKILEAAEKSTGCRQKNVSQGTYPKLEEALLVWLKSTVASKVPVSGGLLKQKAETMALQMNIEGFKLATLLFPRPTEFLKSDAFSLCHRGSLAPKKRQRLILPLHTPPPHEHHNAARAPGTRSARWLFDEGETHRAPTRFSSRRRKERWFPRVARESGADGARCWVLAAIRNNAAMPPTKAVRGPIYSPSM
ncbi:hypothetical protein HPB50_025638 [Hyalomma asiaticum]|uniref:Uncharacterized protein n=1 Tax=Hyalomma asiaticum TaxID=266040 RepID=A0ACB7TC55_HYAAI|nr:hypothetical protein HPB50_025638 [Hyalomma asiaticum]